MTNKIVPVPKTKQLPPLRVSPQEYRKIKAKAKKYARGNVSAYLRHVALEYGDE